MTLNAAQKAFSARLGHDFAAPDLLEEALTHASLSGPNRRDNQRLEFLGDRVLGLVIAEALLAEDAQANEGMIAPRLNALVRKETCAEIAGKLDLGAALLLGKSEASSGGRRKMALLGDAMEAVIAAVYADAGYDSARALILRHWGKRISTAERHALDAKTALQEWAQARGFQPPDYRELERTGPDHALRFVIEVRVASGETEQAEAATKRAAQQLAAEALLARLERTK